MPSYIVLEESAMKKLLLGLVLENWFLIMFVKSSAIDLVAGLFF